MQPVTHVHQNYEWIQILTIHKPWRENELFLAAHS